MAASALIAACGGPSEEDVRRSQAEYDLGVGLMNERNLAGAFQHLQEATRLDPDNAEAHLVLGTLFLLREDFDPAERELRAALAANERLGRSGRPALESEAHNTLGVLYIHRQRFAEAVTELRLATGDLMNRTPHLAWGNLGWAYYEQRDYAQALEALDQSVQSQPQFCNGWYRIGQVHFAMAQQGGAQQPAAEAPPDGADPSREHLVRADEALTRGLEVDADECRALQDAWLLRGQTRARLGRQEDAIADFERCVELDPNTEAGRQCAGLLDQDDGSDDEPEDGA